MSGNPRVKRNLRVGDLTMPPAAPSRSGPASSSGSKNRRRSTPRSSLPEQNSSTQKRKREASTLDDDLFGDHLFGDAEFVDLVDTDDIPPEILHKSQEESNKNHVRLSAFDCVICMDSVTDLTVTHCGHLFCSECLHSALVINPTKRVCPICRQKVDQLPRTGKFNSKAKGYYPLEVKLVTRKTLGKKPEQSSAARG